jgi:hypothetical protein
MLVASRPLGTAAVGMHQRPGQFARVTSVSATEIRDPDIWSLFETVSSSRNCTETLDSNRSALGPLLTALEYLVITPLGT